jgi:hypothetical protein
MSWYYDNDSSSDDYDCFDDWRPRLVSDDVYPLEYHPFRQLVDAALGYMETQKETPLYDSALFEFMDIAAAAEGWLHWSREIKFHKFLALPAELRLKVYDYYLQDERHTGNLQKYQHTDYHDGTCCIWKWPSTLTMCGRSTHNNIGVCTTSYVHWLPDLAFVNKQLIGEVAIHMLETTELFEFLYNGYSPFKIVPLFTQFLSSFYQNEAFNAIKHINFPQAHRYNEHRVGKVIDEQNPDVQLMLKCTSLETMALTFKWRKLQALKYNENYELVPRDLNDFLDFYQLRPMLEHKSVKKVYLVGKYPHNGENDSLKCLEQFAKWIVKGFREKQDRVVDVYMHKRCTSYAERDLGTKMVFEGV